MPNSSPGLAGLTTNVVFDEQLVNGTAQLLDTNVEFTDVDGNFTGGNLIVSGLLLEDTVGIRNEGTAAGQIAVTGSDIRFGNVIIASFTGGTAGTTLVVTFNASATTAAVDALIQNLTYANSSNTPTATRNLILTINDAAGAVAIQPTSFVEVIGTSNPFDGVNVVSLSAPAFADLDGDGDLDAMIGDGSGFLNYYRNTGTALAPIFAARIGAANPLNGIDVGSISAPTFADIDGDGDLDALIGAVDGTLRYYRNTGTAVAPIFTLQAGAANPFNGVDVGFNSTPTFADLDGDGDLDAVIGEDDGILNYFQNTGTALAPVFTEQTGTANPFNGIDVGFRSAPAFADLDGDSDFDLLIGEDGGTLRYYRNTGTAVAPAFTEQTGTANPFSGVDVGGWTTPSFADLNGDGDLDALFGEQDGIITSYRNTAPSASTPSFAEQTGTANPFNGIDVGSSSIPTFADLDGDGDLDVLIGTTNGAFKYYRNTSTVLVPVFAEQTGTANPFNGVTLSYSSATFADLDGDGDLDALIGRFDGILNYYRNTGTALAPVFTEQTGVANPFDGVDVGFYSTPSFTDLDGDGDLDAVIGESDGVLNYFRNTGTALAPVFTRQTGATNPFDGVDVGSNSAPTFADLDGDGDLDAMIGEAAGTLRYYRNTGTALAPVFIEQVGNDNPFKGVDIGSGSTPSFADLDGDGDLDALIGKLDGTLNYYRNTGSGFVLTINVTAQNENPFTNSNDVVNLNTLLASGNYRLSDVTNALDGNDSVTLSSTVNVGVAFNGGIGNDSITGGTSNDIITGGADADTLDGGVGADVMTGGAGDDSYYLDDLGDVVTELSNEGLDLVFASISHTLRANVENLTLTGAGNVNAVGNDLVNLLVGNGGNNILDGGIGADAIRGGGGDDRYTFDNVGDTASEELNEGLDTVVSSVAHTLRANFENLTIIGAATNAFGSSVSNILTGNGLNNILNGKEANDIMTGGAGIDTFMFDTALGPANVDRITDFNPVDDVLRLSSTVFTGIAPGALAATAFRLGTAAGDTSHRIIYDQATGRVFYDADGLGGAAQTLFAILDTKPINLTNADFVVI